MTPQRKWILIAEDDEDLRGIVRHQIEGHYDQSVKVIEASDGAIASQKLLVQAFDCIITDLEMPNKDGQSFIDSVKRSVMNQSTPIIVATGFPDKGLLEKYSELVVIEKPYTADTLIEKIDQQFKLGRLDKRVGAEVLNTLVLVCTEFIRKVVGVEPHPIKPRPKHSNSDLEGDVVCCMKVKTAGGTCRLGLGFDANLIESLYKAVNMDQSDRPKEQMVDVALKVIFKITGKVFYQQTGDYPTLDERVVFKTKSESLYKDIKAAKGVILPIESAAGCLFAHALYVNTGGASSTNKKAS